MTPIYDALVRHHGHNPTPDHLSDKELAAMTDADDRLHRAAQRVSERQHSLAEMCRTAIHDGWDIQRTYELVAEQVHRLDAAWDRYTVIENEIEDREAADDRR